MGKLFIALLIYAFSTLNCFAPTLSSLDKNIEIERNRIAVISEELNINTNEILRIPLSPMLGVENTEHFKISSRYGIRIHPILGIPLMHTGIDIPVTDYSLILAAGNGRVIEATDSKFGYGKCIIIKHNNTYTTLYAHLSKLLIKEGDYVHAGEVIGISGRTGLVCGRGQHLHFELIRNGKPIDPLKVLGVSTAKDFSDKMYKIKQISDYMDNIQKLREDFIWSKLNK